MFESPRNPIEPAEADVLIVGAGPVGLTLALLLARAGLRSLVLEQRDGPTPAHETRALAWMPRGIELLDRLGLVERFSARSTRRTRHEFFAGGRLRLALRFDRLDSPFPHTLDLPQRDSELLLEEAARATGLVELRRGHQVVGVEPSAVAAVARVAPTNGPEYTVAAAYAVACDGFHSALRGLLGVATTARDYGAHSIVADIVGAAELPPETSRIVLDPRRPHGVFPFGGDRVRLVFRVNPGEQPRAMTTPEAVAGLARAHLPGVRLDRLLWASAFRLAQQQSATYRAGRWLLAGDAAHAMGPSAGAGLQLGVLGAFRLAWRLALATRGHRLGDALLTDYAHEQRAAGDQIQGENALIFRNMALQNWVLAAVRAQALGLVGRSARIVGRMTAVAALEAAHLPVASAADRPADGRRDVAELGPFSAGSRVPAAAIAGLAPAGDGPLHTLLGLGPDDAAQQQLLADLAAQLGVPAVTRAGPVVAPRPAVAVVRPDQEVVALRVGGR